MPNRIVRDSLLDSPRWHALSSDGVRLLFVELLLLADDYGLTPVYPLFLARRTASARRATDPAITKMVSELADADLIRVYQAKGQAYAYIPRFGNWPRAKKTKWPMPPDELGGREIKDLQQKRTAGAEQPQSDGRASAPETETETETGTGTENTHSSASGRGVRVPNCPHRKILALYREKLPTRPQPRPELWEGSKGASALRERWDWLLRAERGEGERAGERYATTEAEGLAWFGRFFDAVAASDFLCGRAGTWGGADLGWLVKKANFDKVVQGNYTNRENA